jgi:Caspase domain
MTDAPNGTPLSLDAGEQEHAPGESPAPSQLERALREAPEDDQSVDNTTEQIEHRQSDGEDPGRQDTTQDEGVNLTVWPCGCDQVSDSHLENFATFQRHVREGLKNMKSQDVCYDSIEVLVIYWKESDVVEVGQNAKALADVFEKAPYGFNVTRHEFNNPDHTQKQIDNTFKKTLKSVEERVHAEDAETSNLLIVYYGGHGTVENADRLWKPMKTSVKNLIWSKYQNYMYDIECDILYLFDCCHSLAMCETSTTKPEYRRRCEIFCSAGLKEKSGAQTRTNFTAALKAQLETAASKALLEQRRSIGGLTFENICEQMTKKEIRDTLIAEPRFKASKFANPSFRGRIALTKRGNENSTSVPPPPPPQAQQDDSGSGYESQIEARSQISNTRILIKIRLANPAEGLSSDDWLKWFEKQPHNVAHIDLAVVKKIEWVGVFETDSSLALMTVLLWLWNYMEQDPACESLGIVRSANLLKRPADTEELVARAKLKEPGHEVKEVEQTQVASEESLDDKARRIEDIDSTSVKSEDIVFLNQLLADRVRERERQEQRERWRQEQRELDERRLRALVQKTRNIPPLEPPQKRGVRKPAKLTKKEDVPTSAIEEYVHGKVSKMLPHSSIDYLVA